MSEVVAASSSSFDLLHEGVQRWIWDQGWERLRDIQERSIPLVCTSDTDLVIAAATASGKTEAAFLPIVSGMAHRADAARAAHEDMPSGFQAIYVSPLKALINDQFRRMDDLCGTMGIPVVKWHGDVAASVKKRARAAPSGILLITPESLEAMLCLRGTQEARRMLGALRHVVVDELHAFLGNERGCQLRSVLHRIETLLGRRVCRIGLSATLADMTQAAEALRPNGGQSVHVLVSTEQPGRVAMQVRGYPRAAVVKKSDAKDDAEDEDAGSEEDRAMLGHMFSVLRNTRALVFAGSRRNVETLTVALEGMAEDAGMPEGTFMPHHGSLSRELREEAERRMRLEDDLPRSVVCTTTLELGLDVGPIKEAVQDGTGFTVTGMRQRMGRTGRREGEASVLRTYVRETTLDARSHPIDRLRTNTVKACAMTDLLLRRWNEPVDTSRMDLSTAVQQVLALTAQDGGLRPVRGWAMLGLSGVFPHVDADTYKTLLDDMKAASLLEEAPDGLLLLGERGEAVVNNHEFYAAFMTPEEYRVTEAGGRTIGMIPVGGALVAGELVLLGGRRWCVSDVDAARRVVTVVRALGGKPPVFGGGLPSPHTGVVMRMREVYLEDTMPAYLDTRARAFLTEGRDAFRLMGLDCRALAQHGDETLVFPWLGGRKLCALRLALVAAGMEVEEDTVALVVRQRQEGALISALERMAGGDVPDTLSLAATVPDLVRAKYDRFLSRDLLLQDWAAEHVDVEGLSEVCVRLLSMVRPMDNAG